jgi:hypothetical protein
MSAVSSFEKQQACDSRLHFILACHCTNEHLGQKHQRAVAEAPCNMNISLWLTTGDYLDAVHLSSHWKTYLCGNSIMSIGCRVSEGQNIAPCVLDLPSSPQRVPLVHDPYQQLEIFDHLRTRQAPYCSKHMVRGKPQMRHDYNVDNRKIFTMPKPTIQNGIITTSLPCNQKDQPIWSFMKLSGATFYRAC